MNKQIASLIFLLALCLGVSAQTPEKTIEKIRETYISVAEKTRLAENDEDQGQFGELVMNELVINKSGHHWRAVGIYEKNYKYFYKGGDSEARPYPDQLVLVRAESKVSNRLYREEFLYDKSGLLIFYVQLAENDGLVPAERRIYFDAAKPIRIIEDGKTRDRPSAKDITAAKEIMSESTRIKEVFRLSIKL